MPTIYNVKTENRRVDGRSVAVPVMYSIEARETPKLYKLSGRDAGFDWAINLPKEARYTSAREAWDYWLQEKDSEIYYFQEKLHAAGELRDQGFEQSEVDCP